MNLPQYQFRFSCFLEELVKFVRALRPRQFLLAHRFLKIEKNGNCKNIILLLQNLRQHFIIVPIFFIIVFKAW